MSKIDAFEKRIIEQGLQDEDLIEYGKLLGRVRGNYNKRQHCYTTAIQFPEGKADDAVKLIQYGLDNFDDDWFSTYQSYLYIGKIYEKTGDYKRAFDALLLARGVLGDEQEEYIKDISRDLLWMKLHIDKFSYSKEMEKYYLCYSSSNEISKSFINNKVVLAIAEIIVFMHQGKTVDAKRALEEARQICTPGYSGALTEMLLMHNYQERLKLTPEAKEFLDKIDI